MAFKCGTCKGTGEVRDGWFGKKNCPACDGTGETVHPGVAYDPYGRLSPNHRQAYHKSDDYEENDCDCF